MKKTVIFAVALLGLCSCNKAKIFTGDYAYKTSGTLTISRTDTTAVLYELKQVGQLNVIDLKSSKKDSVLLVFNELGGNITTVRAKVDGDSLRLVPYTKTISLQSGLLQSVSGEIKVSGCGVRYDDIIMLDEVYDGELTSDTTTIKIYGSHIATVANRN